MKVNPLEWAVTTFVLRDLSFTRSASLTSSIMASFPFKVSFANSITHPPKHCLPHHKNDFHLKQLYLLIC